MKDLFRPLRRLVVGHPQDPIEQTETPVEEQAPLIRVLHPSDRVASVKDRVVRRLLAVGLMTRAQVHAAQLLAEPGETLWRVAARLDGVDRDAIMEAAAMAYGFAHVQVSLVGSIALMDRVSRRLPADAWSIMADISVMPVLEEGTAPDPDGRLFFAADDPSSLEVRSRVSDWTNGVYQLGYLPLESVSRCLDEASRLLPHLFPSGLRILAPVVERSSERRAA